MTPLPHLPDTPLQNIQPAHQVVLRNNQRRGERQHVAHGDLEAKAALQGAVEHRLGGVGGRGLGFAVLDQLDAEQQAAAANVAPMDSLNRRK